MSVNLSNINISLDQFNAQARGDYNIGQMKLSEDGTSIYRANKHKTLTFLNTTKISQEEALAVKDAFCRALSNRGLSPDDLAAVKNKLGIGDDKFYRLKTGQITPLTAAEVREIIDQYAASLNASGATKLETSADIYKGVSKETLEKRAEKRGEVNYDTVSSMLSAKTFAVASTLAPDAVKTMYVGMTRAKHTLRLSYPMNYGKRAIDLCEWVKNAINPDLTEEVDKSDYTIEEHLTQEINSLFKS